MKRAVLAALGLAACTGLSTGTAPVAIEFVNPPASITAGDSVQLRVRVLDRAGDSVGATVRLITLNPDTLKVDSVRLVVYGVQDTLLSYPVTGAVVAAAGNLQSLPLSITVTAPTP